MDIETLFKDGINYLKSNWKLPEKGFIAGGSISNIIWNLHTGKNAPINDIDIYVMNNLITEKLEFKEFKNKQHYKKKESFAFEDYSGLGYGWKTSEFYLIDDVTIDGIFNYINYSSNTLNPQLILDSFDINCCQIGYNISEDKFYYTNDFILFLETGELRLINLTSPSHTAVRLVKKKNELNAILPTLELDILSFSLGRIGPHTRFIDTVKSRFKERYANIFRKYEGELSTRFKLIDDPSSEPYLQSIGVTDKLYYLVNTKETEENHPLKELHNTYDIGCQQSTSFLYWTRHIMGDIEMEKLWLNIHHVIDINLGIENYIDIEFTKENISLLNRIINSAPNSINNLKGLTLSRQLEIINILFQHFHNDPIIAIAILEVCKFNNVDLEDEMSLLLLELSVRKKILDDPTDKVRKIMNPYPTERTEYVTENDNFF